MTPHVFQCPGCNQKLIGDSKHLGKTVTCPSCKIQLQAHSNAVVIPELSQEKPVVSPQQSSSSDTSKSLAQPGQLHAHAFTSSKTIPCPDCGKQISKRAPACPSCGAPMDVDANGAMGASPSGHSNSQAVSAPEFRISVQQVGSGKLICKGPYERLFSATKSAFQLCQVSIKQESQDTGEIRGNAPYGMNLFGMSIYASLSSMGSQTKIEISASFSDAFDNFGACSKKVAQISEQLVDLLTASFESIDSKETNSGISFAPRLRSKNGQSYQGKAITGFFLSLLGLCFGPVALFGVIFSCSAYSTISASKNKEGKGWALVGIIVGFIGLMLWVFVAFFVIGAKL